MARAMTAEAKIRATNAEIEAAEILRKAVLETEELLEKTISFFPATIVLSKVAQLEGCREAHNRDTEQAVDACRYTTITSSQISVQSTGRE
jgi:hypothetical protein